MGALTRKRAAAAREESAAGTNSKRVRTDQRSPTAAVSGKSPTQDRSAASPKAATGTARGSTPAPKKGSRGAAFLAAAGIALPAAEPEPPKLSTKKESASKAARRLAEVAAAEASLRSARKRRNPLLDQVLPLKLGALLDMFGGLQTVYEVMRKRGQRTTYQHMRQAVEEASGRRFLLSHVAQLKHLLPEALEVEWVRLPVAAAPSSNRTEPHLLITLHMAAAAQAAAAEEVASSGATGPGELQAARHLLHCRLAAHLLEDYRQHLGTRAAELEQAGDKAAAEQLQAAQQAAGEPPVVQFVPPYPDGAADVPQQELPARPEVAGGATPASRAASPTVLPPDSAVAAAAAQQLGLQGTPATAKPQATPSATTTGRRGRPPVHPNTLERQRLKQRRLSFGKTGATDGAGGLAAVPEEGGSGAAAATPSRAALSAAAGYGQAPERRSKTVSPLDKLHSELQQQQQQQGGGGQAAGTAAGKGSSGLALHPRQQELAGAVSAADFKDVSSASFAASLASSFGVLDKRMSAEDAALLASMPEELRRRSTDGIISLETLRMLEAVDQQHRRLSSQEARDEREASAALGQLPRTFSRLQRIFGMQGPNAMKLRDVIQRIKQAAETSSEAQIEAQLRALAQHAPEYLSFKPWGRCGTPALWINRGSNPNVIMARLKQVAEARHAQRAAGGAAADAAAGAQAVAVV